MKILKLIVLLLGVHSSGVLAVTPEVVLNRYMTAWGEHDIPKIGSFYAENISWYDLSSNKTVSGKVQVTKAITDAFLGQVSDMYWVQRGDLFLSENTVIYEWRYGGTFTGKWGEHDIDNRVFSINGISTTSIDDTGKIVFQKDYYDVGSFERALGVGQ